METKDFPQNGTNVLRRLRCKRTGRYFTGEAWTPQAQDARAYASDLEAVEACVQHKLKDVELVLSMPGAKTEFFTTALA